MTDDNVFDLGAVAREAQQTPFQFRWDGDVYEMPIDPGVVFVGLLGDEKIVEALEEALGPDQWQRLKASPTKLGVKAFGALLNEYMRHIGIEAPNSSPSTVSSNSTARR